MRGSLGRGAAAGARSRLLVGEIDRQRTAYDRLDAGRRHLLGEFERAEHVVSVGEHQRRLPVGLGELGQPRDRQRAFKQRIRGVDVKMYEAGFGHGPSRVLGVPIFPCASTVRAAAGAVHRRQGLRANPAAAYPQPR